MALGNATINQLNESMSSSQNFLKKYYDELQGSMEALQSNVNYRSFVENTEIGQTLNEKLTRIKTVGDKTASDVNQLLKTTSEFAERQRALNSANGGSDGVGGVSYSPYQGEPQSMGIGASAGDVTPTTITAGQAAGTESGMTITNGKVTIPGGTSIPGSAVTRW